MTAGAAGLSRIPDAVLSDLKGRYVEPQRHYHTWEHITALLGWFDLRATTLNDPDAVFLAILFHDAVYDPRGKDNETRSEMLLARTALPEWSQESIDRARRMIAATTTHTLPPGLEPAEGADVGEFLDMDMSILGASQSTFDAYDKAIRREYRHVPGLLYHPARKRILSDFLNRQTLYFSIWGQDRFDQAARANLRRVVGARKVKTGAEHRG